MRVTMDGTRSLLLLVVVVCQAVIVAPCQQSAMQQGTVLDNAQADTTAGDFFLTPLDVTLPFSADYVTSGSDRVTFNSVTFSVFDGGASTVTITVYDGPLQTGQLDLQDIQDGAVTVATFPQPPVGNSIVITAAVATESCALTIQITDVANCVTETCSAGWQGLGDFCYKLFAENQYDLATVTCQGEGGEVAPGKTEAEYTFVYQTVAGSVGMWLGGDDQETEGTWVWQDGSLAANGYTNWKSDEPSGDHNGMDADCIWVVNNGLWRDAPCSWMKPFVCKVSSESQVGTTPPPATECAASWTKYEGACYKFYSASLHYDVAKSACTAEQAYLAPAKTQGEFDLIHTTLAGGGAHWLGGDDTATEGTWVWLDSTSVSSGYTNWKTGEPDNVQNSNTDCDCLWVLASGQWRDAPCTWTKPYICKYDLA